MDRQARKTPPGTAGWHENHQILCLGTALLTTHIWVPSEGDEVSTFVTSRSTHALMRWPPSSYVRSLLLIRSGNNAVAMSLPVLASVLSFVTYSLLGLSTPD